jgi:hypothetical protein
MSGEEGTASGGIRSVRRLGESADVARAVGFFIHRDASVGSLLL